MRLLALIPWDGNPVHDAQRLVNAASLVGEATSEVVDIYSTVSGGAVGAPRLFADGQVDLASLTSLSDSVRHVDDT